MGNSPDGQPQRRYGTVADRGLSRGNGDPTRNWIGDKGSDYLVSAGLARSRSGIQCFITPQYSPSSMLMAVSLWPSRANRPSTGLPSADQPELVSASRR